MTTPPVGAPKLGGSIRMDIPINGITYHITVEWKHHQGNEGISEKSKTEPANGSESARRRTFPFFTILRTGSYYKKREVRYINVTL